MWGITVIKVVVLLGLVCVGGIGAIAAATSKSAPVPTPSVVYPTVAGAKADRLSLVSMQDIQPTVGKVALAYSPPSEPQSPAQPRPKEVAKTKAPEFIPRHWHDPNDPRAAAKELKSEPSRDTSRSGSPTKVAESRDCRTDGFGSLWFRLFNEQTQPAADVRSLTLIVGVLDRCRASMPSALKTPSLRFISVEI